MGIRIVTRLWRYILLLILFHMPTGNVHSSADLWYKPVKYIRIESDTRISSEYVLQAVTIKENDPLTPEAVRESLRNINLLNRFYAASVWGEPFLDGCALIFNLKQAWVIEKINFKSGAVSSLFSYGLIGKFSPKTLQRQISLFQGDIFSPEKGLAAINALKDFYLNNGYADCSISLHPHYHDGFVDLVFTINQGHPTRIREIVFSDNLSVSRETLLKQTGLSNRKTYSRKRLNNAREKLEKFYRRRGYLNAQVFRPEIQLESETNEVTIRFKIMEYDQIHLKMKAETETWNLLWKLYSLERRPDQFLKTLGLEGNDRLDRNRFEEAARNLQRRYWNKGFLNADVRLEEIQNEFGKTVYSFEITKNDPVLVDQILIAGNPHFSTDEILSNKIIQTRTGKRYKHDSFMADAEELQEWYIEHGFHKARVTTEQTICSEKTSVSLHLLVDEGPQYFWNAFIFEGNSSFPDTDLLKLLQLSSGNPFVFTAIEPGINRILDHYLSNGYTDVTIEWSIVDLDATKPSLKIVIEEGIQSTINTVIVKGYNKTLRSVIDRNLPKLVGRPLYYKTLLETERQLIRTNLFRSAEVSTPPWESYQPKRTLLIDLKEQPFIFLEGGPGYNSDRGFNGYLSLFTTNLGGSNRYLGLSGLLSEKEYKGNIVFREPEFANLPVQLELRLLAEKSQEKNFNLFRRGSRATWSYSLTRFLRALLIYRFDYDEPYDIGQDAELPEEYRNSVKIGSLAPGFLFDSRNDPQSPRSGSLLSAKIEYARKMYSSEVHFTKLTTETTHFFDLSRFGVLGTSVRLGWAYGLPYQEEFRLGGIKSIRGWDFDTIRKSSMTTPGDIINITRRDIDVSILANIEYRYPLVWGFEGVLFYDTGNVFDDYKDMSFSRLKSTIGLGTRFMTPVGPVGIDYGYNILRDKDDPSYRWSFVIGHTF
ncbi:MAG: POTRA domain-containing protein [bacterium]